MANLGQAFNVNEMPQSENNFEPIPAGWYNCTIGGAELKDTKAGTGQYIAVRYNITGPSHEGRVIFGNLNIRNPNPKAQEIGLQQLGDMMRAIGLASVEDTDQIIGGQLSIKVKIREASGGYDASNDVSGFKALAGGIAPAPAKAAPTQTAPAAGAPPWAK